MFRIPYLSTARQGIGLIRPSVISTNVTTSRHESRPPKSDESKLILPSDLEHIDSHKYCVTHVRRFDRENYLAAIFIKDNLCRRAVFCLRAFNVELALVKDLTSDINRAKLRFHFWSKLIDELMRRNNEKDINVAKELAYYKQSPIAKELLDIFHLVNIEEDMEDQLRNLIGSRVSSKIMGDEPIESMDELELYCSKSNASIYQLSYKLSLHLHNKFQAEPLIDEPSKRICVNLGLAHGLANVIRGIPYNAAMRCCYIPKDLLDRTRLTREDFMIIDRVKQKPTLDGHKIAPAVTILAHRCQELLKLVVRDQRDLPDYFRELYLPRVAIQSYLKRLRKCNYNVCDPRLHQKNGLLALSMKLATIYYRLPVL